MPVKPIATASHNCVWLRQARGRSGREVDFGDAGRDRNVKLTVRAEGDAVCTWERALGSKRRERFLTRRFPKKRSACRVRGVNCSVGRDGEVVELASVRCVCTDLQAARSSNRNERQRFAAAFALHRENRSCSLHTTARAQRR